MNDVVVVFEECSHTVVTTCQKCPDHSGISSRKINDTSDKYTRISYQLDGQKLFLADGTSGKVKVKANYTAWISLKNSAKIIIYWKIFE